MVEQWTDNPLVAGSNPAPGTKFWAVIELGFLAALQAVIGGFDSHTVHHSFALIVKWYNAGFVIRSLQFDSV